MDNDNTSLFDNLFEAPDYSKKVRAIEFQQPYTDGITPNVTTDSKPIVSTLNFLAKSIAQTYGPYGSNTIVRDGMGLSHVITKDGYNVLKRVIFKEALPNTVLDLVKRISHRLDATVGDGTTTAVIASSKFYESLQNSDLINQYPPQEVLNALRSFTNTLIDNTDTVSTKIQPDDIYNLALVSTNNDTEIAKLIYEAYMDSGVLKPDTKIQYDTNNDNVCSYRRASEMEAGNGLITPILANKPSETHIYCELENPYVLMVRGELSTREDMEQIGTLIGTVINDYQRPLVIVANKFSPQMIQYFVSMYSQNKDQGYELPIAPIDISDATKLSFEKYRDLATRLDGKILDMKIGDKLETINSSKVILEEYLGECGRFESKDASSTFIECADNPERISARIEVLDNAIDDLNGIEDQFERDQQVEELQKRKANLTGNRIKLFIGGNSKQEIETRAYLVQDAIRACESAAKWGIVRGLSLHIPTLLKKQDYREKFITSITSQSMLQEKAASDLLDVISKAYRAVTWELFYKPFEYSSYLDKIKEELNDIVPDINSSLDNEKQDIFNALYDILLNDESISFDIREGKITNNTIINSLQTEVEILKGITSIVSILATSNQFVSAV